MPTRMKSCWLIHHESLANFTIKMLWRSLCEFEFLIFFHETIIYLKKEADIIIEVYTDLCSELQREFNSSSFFEWLPQFLLCLPCLLLSLFFQIFFHFNQKKIQFLLDNGRFLLFHIWYHSEQYFCSFPHLPLHNLFSNLYLFFCPWSCCPTTYTSPLLDWGAWKHQSSLFTKNF